jgi:hypothetical protein
VVVNGNRDSVLAEIRSRQPAELDCQSLSLEEIFVAAGTLARAKS